MAYADLARSHVKECLREGFELDRLVVDEDGDVPFCCGTATYYVTVRRDGQRVKVWSRAVTGVTVTAKVLRELNQVAATLELARVFAVGGSVLVEGVLPVDGLAPDVLHDLCQEVGATADRVGQLISTVHGGTVARPGGCDGGCES